MGVVCSRSRKERGVSKGVSSGEVREASRAEWTESLVDHGGSLDLLLSGF